MMVHCPNEWDVDAAEAIAIQLRLAPLVSTQNELGHVTKVAGLDVGFVDGMARAAVAVLDFPGLSLLEVTVKELPATFPYVPGLLSFREAPAAIAACEAVRLTPDLIVVDGQGIAHPRRLGIASHLGLCLGIPTIGCAKSLLVGHVGPLGEDVGSTVEIVDRGQVVGAAVRTKRGIKPVYVSIGHRLDLQSAIDYVLRCCRGYRLPEPQRQAHLAASAKADR